MRFTFVSTLASVPWGGSEELWSRTALALREQGHEVNACVKFWDQPAPKVVELQKAGIKFHFSKSSLAAAVCDEVRMRLRLPTADEAWLRGQKASSLVVVAQAANADGRVWMRRCQKFGLPFVAIVQCNSELWLPPDPKTEEVMSAFREARKIFCVSRQNLDVLRWQFGDSVARGEVVWNPCNVPAGPPNGWPVDTGICKLACVARLEPAIKGQDLLIEMLAQPKWRERSLELNFYGSGAWERRLRRMVDSKGLQNVHFRGHVSDVRKVWEENHLFVLASRAEGLPLALVESMWCGRPAVVTNVGGNAEICVDNETGFVAPLAIAKDVEQAMERAWQRRPEWPQMGLAARARVERLVPPDPVGDFCKKLKECVGKNGHVTATASNS